MSLRNLDDKELEMVEIMGGTGFTPEEIAEVLQIEADKFMDAFNDPHSIVFTRYRKGYLLQSVKLRQRIFKDASNGSSPAQTLAKKILDDSAFRNHEFK